ncbi:MAG: 2-C-methyl-D-erythritol 4-phosphate cytidylyltransferase [Thiobacillaceae bacterium]|nr:2-C-methyl-D-erythritol 4-phosphate cytidylyltransferase [Thiobacillaceae bacterium]MDW8324100.1 2-C-methyl-D-erythritol 4-phosphate cytidylyltransferase [Burkholderiales bacterium]
MTRYHALVPAAGAGTRMGAARPKQYLELAGRPLLWYALHTLCRHPRIARVYVVLAPDDAWWGRYDWDGGDKLMVLSCGGATRADSVRAGLAAMAGEVAGQDWVLVHDAARPCLTAALIDRLIEALREDPVGGLLAVPLADTVKRAGADARIAATVDRSGLWAAQTPQMFRYGLLTAALAQAGGAVTDEASAVEALGHAPRLVEGARSNLKVTFPEDLELAGCLLGVRGEV